MHLFIFYSFWLLLFISFEIEFFYLDCQSSDTRNRLLPNSNFIYRFTANHLRCRLAWLSQKTRPCVGLCCMLLVLILRFFFTFFTLSTFYFVRFFNILRSFPGITWEKEGWAPTDVANGSVSIQVPQRFVDLFHRENGTEIHRRRHQYANAGTDIQNTIERSLAMALSGKLGYPKRWTRVEGWLLSSPSLNGVARFSTPQMWRLSRVWPDVISQPYLIPDSFLISPAEHRTIL